ncbi:hypothetical protein [Microvirga alba]|uniref:Uncharacterized protein n=1 Tax=Microvirga alba TaxID=2791025 RepID=A0A931BN01_9HYPH|nr:hypothetical protein [Microvirga alba]MBF9232918.1 hypothetical protein [Microvirga alba]
MEKIGEARNQGHAPIIQDTMSSPQEAADEIRSWRDAIRGPDPMTQALIHNNRPAQRAIIRKRKNSFNDSSESLMPANQPATKLGFFHSFVGGIFLHTIKGDENPLDHSALPDFCRGAGEWYKRMILGAVTKPAASSRERE